MDESHAPRLGSLLGSAVAVVGLHVTFLVLRPAGGCTGSGDEGMRSVVVVASAGAVVWLLVRVAEGWRWLRGRRARGLVVLAVGVTAVSFVAVVVAAARLRLVYCA